MPSQFTARTPIPEKSLGCAMCGECCNPVKLAAPKEQHLKNDPVTLAFARKYWHELKPNGKPGVRYACDKYDSETRQCTAHDERPPVCSGFPWYGRGPSVSRIVGAVETGPGGVGLSCSFMADIPAEWRPRGEHHLIPIMPVEKK